MWAMRVNVALFVHALVADYLCLEIISPDTDKIKDRESSVFREIQR